MKITVIDLKELEEIIRGIIREELRKAGSSIDEIGDITLAMKITGLKSGTVYKKCATKRFLFSKK